jgi:hypothetical protein
VAGAITWKGYQHAMCRVYLGQKGTKPMEIAKKSRPPFRKKKWLNENKLGELPFLHRKKED